MVKNAFAQTSTPTPVPLSMPSVPVFSIAIINSSYYQPSGYSTNPSTGNPIYNVGGSFEAVNITLTIQNQPLALSQQNTFVYDIQIKPHYSTSWIDLYEFPEGYLSPSNGQSTAVTFQFTNGSYVSVDGVPGNETLTLLIVTSNVMLSVPLGGQVDFQVRAGIEANVTKLPDNGLFNGELSD